MATRTIQPNDWVAVKLGGNLGLYQIIQIQENEILIVDSTNRTNVSKIINTNQGWKISGVENIPYEFEYYPADENEVYISCIARPLDDYECFPYGSIATLLSDAESSADHGDYSFKLYQGEIGKEGWTRITTESMGEIEELYSKEALGEVKESDEEAWEEYQIKTEQLWNRISEELSALNLPEYIIDLNREMTLCDQCEKIVLGHVDCMNNVCEAYRHSMTHIDQY